MKAFLMMSEPVFSCYKRLFTESEQDTESFAVIFH